MSERNGWKIRRWADSFSAVGACLCLTWLGSGFDSQAEEIAVPDTLARFSESLGALPSRWRPLTFPKIKNRTRYRSIRDADTGVWVIEATSLASASGLIHPCEIDLHERPILRWRWKVERVLSKGDARRRDGDDYAARIYLTFEPSPQDLTLWERASLRLARTIYGDVPSRAINYVWANRLEKGTMIDSAYVGKFVKLVAVQSGAGEAGRWHTQERDVFADYRRLFGVDPPAVVGVAIMTDSDDTGEQTRAWYGDVEFVSRSTPRTEGDQAR